MKRKIALAFLSFAFYFSISQIAEARNGIYYIHKSNYFDLRSPVFKTSAAAHANLVYYGGPVLSHVKVYVVFWGPNNEANVKSDIGGFFTSVVNSTYIDWLTEYDTTNIKSVDGRSGTQQTINRGTYAGSIEITQINTNTTLSDQDIENELQTQIKNHVLPAPDENTLFMTYFPAGITITIDNLTSCQDFCAYHNGFKSSSFGNIIYGVMPDVQSGGCIFGCGMNSDPFGNVTEVSSHEFVESITDPLPTAGNTPSYPQAWIAEDGNEIGDLCVGQGTNLTTQSTSYVLQQEWDNKISACAAGPYTNP